MKVNIYPLVSSLHNQNKINENIISYYSGGGEFNTFDKEKNVDALEEYTLACDAEDKAYIAEVYNGVIAHYDELMEDAQALHGIIEVGEIKPELPEETEIENLLQAIRGLLADSKEKLKGKLYTGMISTIDEFWHVVNKTIYLVQIEKRVIGE